MRGKREVLFCVYCECDRKVDALGRCPNCWGNGKTVILKKSEAPKGVGISVGRSLDMDANDEEAQYYGITTSNLHKRVGVAEPVSETTKKFDSIVKEASKPMKRKRGRPRKKK